MTNRLFGTSGIARAALAIALAAGPLAPVAAQQAETPTPAPSPGSTIDFRLPVPEDDGRAPGVQGPANNGLAPLAPGERRGPPQTPTPTPAPTPAPPRVTPTQPGTGTTAAPTPAPTPRERPATQAAPARDAPAPSTDAGASAPAPSLPEPPVLSDPSAEAAPPAADEAPLVRPAPADDGGTPLWAWLLAAIAAAGAGFWYWRRRPVPAGDAPAETEAPPAEAPLPLPRSPAPRPAAPLPAPRPVPAPGPPAARSPTLPGGDASQRAPSPLVTRPAPERRALVSLALEVTAIRMTADHIAVAFALNLFNQGSADATGLMVRIALNQGSAMPEPVLARFFDGAGGSVLRDDMVMRAGAGETLTTEAMLPRAIVEPLVIGGKPMLVPVMAFDVTYHWEGDADAFGQVAGSFVLGREQGTSGSDKLAPLPLGRASYSVDRPGARATAVRRSQ